MIPSDAYKHPIVAEALAQAAALIDKWERRESSGGDARVAEVVQGWTRVALGEAIAWALLEERGFDIEGLADALSAASRQAVADVLGAWPRRICSAPGPAAATAFDVDMYDCTCGHPFGEHEYHYEGRAAGPAYKRDLVLDRCLKCT